MTTINELIREDRPAISERSIRTYIANLKKIGVTDEDDLQKLTKSHDVLAELEILKPTMKRNILSSILVIIKAAEMPNEIYNKYKEALATVNENYYAELGKNTKTATMEHNWTSMAVLKGIAKKMLKTSVNQNSLIAALYTYQPPVRLDYYKMKIVKPKDKMDERMNYLVVYNRNKKVFVFRDYKTAGKYSEVKIPVSKELNTVLNKFLKAHPDRTFLLEKKRTIEPLSRNGMGKMLPIVFEESGKHITLNLIRHMYVSENINLDRIKKEQELAKNMMHDSGTQQTYAKND